MEKSARTSPNNVRNKRAMFEGNVSGESSPKSTRTPRKDTCSREGTRGRNKSAPPVNRRRDTDYNPVYNQTDILKEYGPSAVWLLREGYKNSGKNGWETDNNNSVDINKNSGRIVAEESKTLGKLTTEAFKSKTTNPNAGLLSSEAPNQNNRNRVINHHITQTTTYKNNSKFTESTYLPPLPKSPPPSSPTFPNLLLSPPPLPPKFTNHISPPASLLPSSPSSPVSPVTQSVLSKTSSLPFKTEMSEKYAAERIERRSRAYKSTRTDERNKQHDMQGNVDGSSSRDKQSVMQHLRNIFGERVPSTQPIQPLKQRSKSVTRDSGAKHHAKAFATDISKETYLFSRNPSGKIHVPTWETSQKFEKVYSTYESNPKSPQVHRSQIVIELDGHEKPIEVNKAARKALYSDDKPIEVNRAARKTSYSDDKPIEVNKAARKTSYSDDKPIEVNKAARKTSYSDDKPIELNKAARKTSYLDDKPIEVNKAARKTSYSDDKPIEISKAARKTSYSEDKPIELNKAARKTSYPVKNKTKPQIDQCKENFTTTQPRNEARNVQERSIPITIQQSTRTDDKFPQFPLADCTKQQVGLHINRQSTVPFLQRDHQAPQHDHTVHQYLVGNKQQLKRSMMDQTNKGEELGTGEKKTQAAASTDTDTNSQFQGKLIKSDKGPSECLIKCALCRNRQIS